MRPSKINPVRVKVGQIWADDDPRMPLRYLMVESIEGEKAVLVSVTVDGRPISVRKTKVHVSRLSDGSARFRLVRG